MMILETGSQVILTEAELEYEFWHIANGRHWSHFTVSTSACSAILRPRLILLVSLFFALALWFIRVYFSVSVLNSYDPHCLDYNPAFNNLQ